MRCRAGRREMLSAACPRKSTAPGSRTRTSRAPPIRRAPRPFRTRKCPKGRDEWYVTISSARTSPLGIIPRWCLQGRSQGLALHLVAQDPAHNQIAVLFDVAPDAFLCKQPRQIFFHQRSEAILLPGVDRHHEMPREALHQRRGAMLLKAFLIERGFQ